MYFINATGWEWQDPETVGLDPAAVEAPVDYHRRNGTPHVQINCDFADYETWDEAEEEYG